MSPRRSSHGDGGAQGHNRPKSPIRRGTAVLRREGQQPGKEFHSDATPLTGSQLRKGSKGEKREERPRCSRWGDGVVVAGLSMARRWCSGVKAFRRGRRSPVVQVFTPAMCSAALVRAPAAVPGFFLSWCGTAAMRSPPWLVVGAPVWPPLPLGFAAAAPCPTLSHGSLSQFGRKGKTQWGWWRWSTSDSPLPLLLKPRHREDGVKSQGCPGLDRPGHPWRRRSFSLLDRGVRGKVWG
jgi:hypothetical protein